MGFGARLLPSGPGRKLRPGISADGNRVAHTHVESPLEPAIRTMEIADISAPGAPRKVCDSGCAGVWDWSLDGQGLFFIRYTVPLSTADSRRDVSVGFLRLPAGEISGYLVDPQRATYQAHLSPRTPLSAEIRDSGAIGLAVACDRIVFPLGEMTGSFWQTKLKLD